MKQESGQKFLENLNLQKQSTENELEFAVFGRGYGECILIKYDACEYMVVDSFINPETKNPIVIDYLNSLKVSTKCIKKIVITHWHRDHIAGISDIIKQSSDDVKIIINPIVKNDKFFEFISLSKEQKQESTKEFVNVLDYIERSNGQNIFLASNNRPIIGKDDIEIKTLSPQDCEIWDHIYDLNTRLLNNGVGYDIPDNNELSIVLLFKYHGNGILLGSDLENGKDPNTSWNGIIKNYSDIKANIFKIPHHGSFNAHNDDVWKLMVEAFPVSILTTFNKGKKLPTDEDIKRILNLSKKLYIIGQTPKRNKDIERLAKKIITDVSITTIPRLIGLVRYRFDLISRQSKFETFGAVVKYTN